MNTVFNKRNLLINLLFFLLLLISTNVIYANAQVKENNLTSIDVTLSDTVDFHIPKGNVNDIATLHALNNHPELSSVYIDEIQVESINDYQLVSSQTDFSKQKINNKTYNIKLVNEDVDLSHVYTKRIELKDYDYELFTGAHYSSETIQPGNIIYTLHSEWKTYQINYDLDGGILPTNAPKTYNPSQTFQLPEPSKQGYEFIGWIDSQTSEVVNEVLLGSYGDKNYIAQWKLTEFKITYDTQGGTLPTDAPLTYNSSTGLTKLPTPTKTGYIFKGWSDGVAIQQKIIPVVNNVNGIIDESTGSYKISSIGTSYPRTLTLTFELKYSGTIDFVILENTGNGLEVLKELRNDRGELIYTPNAYSNHYDLSAGKYELIVGYIGSPFEDKTTDIIDVSIIDNQINYIDNIPAGLTGDKHFVAQWERNSMDTFNITYELDGGIAENPDSYNPTAPESFFTLNNPVKEGYVFLGWTGSNGDEPEKSVTVNDSYLSSGDLHFEANWAYCNVTVNFVWNNGTTALNTFTYTFKDSEEVINIPLPDEIDGIPVEWNAGKSITIYFTENRDIEYTAVATARQVTPPVTPPVPGPDLY